MQGKTQEAAAAGMSVRSAGKWQRGLLPAERKSPRTWRTRPDPFTGIWNDVIEPLLRRDPESALQATTVLEWLEERYPGRFSPAQLRTLQRRLRDWRALHGPEQEVFFPQVHPPGREAQMDFTDAGELRVNIAGLPLPHLFFEFILSHSGWRFVDLAFGETFEALQKGLQGALWALGGLPQVVRTDNLSAATHELKETKGRTLTQRYAALLEHYGLQATRTNPRSSHENGVAEQAHYRLKTALAQALIIRGSRDFPSVAGYSAFVQGVVNLEVYYKDHMVERLERVWGEHKSRIDYRHIIVSKASPCPACFRPSTMPTAQGIVGLPEDRGREEVLPEPVPGEGPGFTHQGRCWRCWSWKPRTVSSGGPLGCVVPPGWHRVRPGTPSSINGSRPDYNSNWVSWRKGNS